MIAHHSDSLNPSETTQTLPLVLPKISTVIYKLFGSEVYFNHLKQESRGFGMTFFGNQKSQLQDVFFKDLKNILYKLFLFQHHHFTNFTAYDMEQPTMINVARDPVNRFVSSFYFRRYGFNRNEGVRREFIGRKKQEMVSSYRGFKTGNPEILGFSFWG